MLRNFWPLLLNAPVSSARLFCAIVLAFGTLAGLPRSPEEPLITVFFFLLSEQPAIAAAVRRAKNAPRSSFPLIGSGPPRARMPGVRHSSVRGQQRRVCGPDPCERRTVAVPRA